MGEPRRIQGCHRWVWEGMEGAHLHLGDGLGVSGGICGSGGI